MKMFAQIKLDREIDKDKHYISPGGYEMTFTTRFGQSIDVNFDFLTYEGVIDKDDPTVLHCEMDGLDVESFPDSTFLEKLEATVTEIKEFYVYTGEDNEPEINPVELLELKLINDDDKIRVNKAILGKIW